MRSAVLALDDPKGMFPMEESNPVAILIDFPDISDPVLRLTAAPARLQIVPGEVDRWVTGTYTEVEGGSGYKLTTSGNTTQLSNDWNVVKLRKGLPVFDLELGRSKPYGLIVESGASDKNRCDFGGLPLTSLDFKQGAGEIVLDFAAPNPEEMTRFTVSSGAASVELRNLANANAAEIAITGAAAAMLIDFCGELRRDTVARINSGMADLKISAPKETAVKIVAKTTLGQMKVGDGFMTKEGAYWSEAAVKGETPVLTIDLTTALASAKIWLV
ncbi:MAG: hypothetical protein KF883_10480 [Thermomicrobiales bacterium]|nr:hypothetical protein [Thermomicrobiales bacterium]